MNNRRWITYKSEDHYIFLIPLNYLIPTDMKDSGSPEYLTPNCSLCGKTTEKFKFHSFDYSIADRNPNKAIKLGYICSDHIDEPDFQTKIIHFVSQRLEEIAKNLGSMTPEAFTITSS